MVFVASHVRAVDNLLAAQANPENSSYATASQTSAALTAQLKTDEAFNTLFLLQFLSEGPPMTRWCGSASC